MANNKTLHILSRRLAVNHMHLSSVGSTAGEWKRILRFSKHNDCRERRVIVVVGAGASHGVGLPLAKTAAKRLKRKLNIHKSSLEDELHRLETVYRLKRDDFETVLMAMGTSIGRTKALREALNRMYGHRYLPVLTYEILAHMLKHRFVDAIVNFNFDELLDQSIEDELGDNNYHYVLSDGDCEGVKPDSSHRFKLPLYVKPHGTAGHKSTLRFTRDDYYGLPEDIRQLLLTLFSDLPVTLILVGFGVESFEFSHLIRESVSQLDVFSFNVQNLSKIDNRLEELGKNTFHHIDTRTMKSLDTAMRSLWESISGQFSDYFKPRHVMRHQLICRLFKHANIPYITKKKDHLREYLRDRMLIELTLSVAKCKGLLDLSVLSVDRCGRYYELYKCSNAKCPPLLEICRKLGLKEVGYGRQVTRLLPRDDDDTGKYAVISQEEFRSALGSIRDFVATSASNSVGRKLNANWDLYKQTLNELYRTSEVEVSNEGDKIHSKIFRRANILNTNTSLRTHTLQLLSKMRKADDLLVVAETGEWLLDGTVHEAVTGKRVFLILADLSWAEDLKRAYGEDNLKIRQIPWWTHNKHMTIVGREMKAIKSIYFERRLRSTIISPVKLEKFDTRAVFEIFVNYWIKAESYGRRKPINRKEMENQRKLFKMLHDAPVRCV